MNRATRDCYWHPLAFTAPATAAEIKVISAGAVRSVIAGMIEDYRKRSGDTFDFTVGTTGELRDVIASGKPADLLITSAPLMAELEKTGKLTAGSRTDLGRVGIGVAIREGAPAPDFSTPEAFRKMLLDAKSVAYTAPELGGTSGVHLFALLKKLGIYDEIDQEGDPRQGRHRHLAEGGARRGRDRHHADQRDRAGEGRADGRPAAGGAAAVDRLHVRDPGEQHAARRRARLRRAR